MKAKHKVGEPAAPSGAFIFGVTTSAIAILGVIAVFLLAVFDHPHRAVLLLGWGMILAAVLRGAWPGSPWFSARSRWFDVVVYLIIGGLLLWLAPWTAAIPPGQ